MRRLGAIVCIGSMALASAHADDAADRKKGKQLWVDAMKQFDLGDFDAALKTYDEAYRLYPNPLILNNMGQAERQRHNYERAAFYFKSYLRYEPNAPNRTAIQDLIVELEKLAREQKDSNEHPPDTVHTPPPPPAVQAATQPSGAEPVVGDAHWYEDAVGWTLAGVGVVAFGVGAGCLVHSGSLSDDAKTKTDQREAASLRDSSQTFEITGGISVGVGAALVVGGIVKMVLHDKGHSDSKTNVALGVDGFHIYGTF